MLPDLQYKHVCFNTLYLPGFAQVLIERLSRIGSAGDTVDEAGIREIDNRASKNLP
jgi:hypothetical protein